MAGFTINEPYPNEEMMLRLLTPNDAAFILLAGKEWQTAFNPNFQKKVYETTADLNNLLTFKKIIENAIEADVLPAIRRPKGRAAGKKIFEKLEIPSDMLDDMPLVDYWITLEDLFCFMERPAAINKEHAHGRDALARLVCALVDSQYLNDKELFEYLFQRIETAQNAENKNFKLGDNTLKGCCREILDAFSTLDQQ